MAFDYNKFLAENQLTTTSRMKARALKENLTPQEEKELEDINDEIRYSANSDSPGSSKLQQRKRELEAKKSMKSEADSMTPNPTGVTSTTGTKVSPIIQQTIDKTVKAQLGIKEKKDSRNPPTGLSLSEYIPEDAFENDDDIDDGTEEDGGDSLEALMADLNKPGVEDEFSMKEPDESEVKPEDIASLETGDDEFDDSMEEPAEEVEQYKLMPRVSKDEQGNIKRDEQGKVIPAGYVLVGSDKRPHDISDEDAMMYKRGEISAREAIANSKF